MGVNFMKSIMHECDSTLCLHYSNKYDKEITKNCSPSEEDKVFDGIYMNLSRYIYVPQIHNKIYDEVFFNATSF